MNELKTLEKLTKFGFHVVIKQDEIQLLNPSGAIEWYMEGGTIKDRLFRATLYLEHCLEIECK